MKKIAILAVIFAAACGTSTESPAPDTSSAVARAAKHRDAGVAADASVPHDAYPGPTPGLVTCYVAPAPDNECNLSTSYCCWTNYSAPPIGSCTANGSQCVHSDEHCDGPEDCASGQSCYAHNWSDGDLLHWSVACAATPTDPADRIMCRVGGTACPNGKTCVQASVAGIFDMMLTQYVCN